MVIKKVELTNRKIFEENGAAKDIKATKLSPHKMMNVELHWIELEFGSLMK